MENIVIQHINNSEFKTYYLYFDKDGDKSNEFITILLDSLLEYVFGINYINIKNPKDHAKFFNACEKLYKKKKDTKREGDLGEIILHAILRKYFGTLPLAGRIHFLVDEKMPPKSFDAIHIIPNTEKHILVLGESKMYKTAKGGIDALASDIMHHFNANYMRQQFIRISELIHANSNEIQEKIISPTKKIINDWEYKLRTETTLDNVIDELYIPLLCTYSYDEYQNHKNISDQFLKKYTLEMQNLYNYFSNKKICSHKNLSFILMLFPIPDKDALIMEYYKRIDQEVNNGTI